VESSTALVRIVSVFPGIDSPRDFAETSYQSHVLRPIVSNLAVILAVATHALASDCGIPLIPDPIRVWVLAGFGICVLISLLYLRFLGRAERYLY